MAALFGSFFSHTLAVPVLVSLGANTPTSGVSDVSQLSIAGQANFPDGLNYYTDNQVA